MDMIRVPIPNSLLIIIKGIGFLVVYVTGSIYKLVEYHMYPRVNILPMFGSKPTIYNA